MKVHYYLKEDKEILSSFGKEGTMIRLENIYITYDRPLLKNACIDIHAGMLTVIQGESGCGKTSLLYRVGLLSKDHQLRYSFHGKEINLYNEDEIANYRKTKIGFVFQDYSLIEHLSIYENMRLYGHMHAKEVSLEDVESSLEKVGLDKNPHQTITTLSGGEKQRLAIACALLKEPDLLILDEPTNALDQKNAEIVMTILKNLASSGMAVLLTSHDDDVVAMCDVIYRFEGLTLQSNKEVKSTCRDVSIKNVKLKLSFYIQYFLNYVKAYKGLFASLFLLVGFCICCLVGYTQIGRAFENKHLDNLNNIASREILVTSENDSNGVASYHFGLREISSQEINAIYNSVYCEDVYPFYLGIADKVYIEGEMVGQGYNVQPYTSYQHYEDHLYLKGNDEGVYISYVLAKQLGIESVENLVISIDLVMPSGEIVELNDLPVAGVLKANVINYYSSSDLDLYLPYEWMPQYEIVQALLVYASQYNMIDLMVDEIGKVNSNFGTFNEVSKINALENSMGTLKELTPFMMTIMLLISIALIALIYIKYVTNRRKEMCLLRVNGLSKKEMLFLLMVELMIQAICIGVVSSVLVFILYQGLEYLLEIQVTLNYFKSLIQAVCLSFVFVLIPSIFSCGFYLMDEPAKILRTN